MKIVQKLFYFLILPLLLGFSAFATPGLTTYQAKIVKPDGLPLEASSVNFRFTILDPSGSCALYSENYSAVNMSATGGLISFSLGTGIKTYPASATTFSDVFSNVTANLSCDAGGPVSYSPNADDTRKIVMQFHDGSGWQTLPAMSINAVPYAMYANEAQKISGLPSCNPGEALNYNGVSFSCEAISGGGVTSSTVIAALGYTPVQPGSLGSNNNLPTGSSNSYALGRNNSQITGGGGSNDSILLGFNNNIDNGGGGSNSGYVIGYNNKFNTFGGGSSEAFIFGSNNTVNYSGFVIGRGVSAPANNAIVIGNGYQTLNVMNNNRVGIGTSDPVTTLDVSGGVKVGYENATCDSTLAGTLRYYASSLEYCDGSAWSGFSGSVTSATVVTALGYTPANSATVSTLNTTVSSVSSSVSTANTNIAAVSSSVAAANAAIASVSSTVYSVSSTVSSLAASASALSATVAGLTTTVNNHTTSLTALASAVAAVTSSQWGTSGTTINYMAGKVGIGTSAPTTLLEVAGTATAQSFSAVNATHDLAPTSVVDPGAIYAVGTDSAAGYFHARAWSSAAVSGTILGGYRFGTGVDTARIEGLATENFGAGNGTALKFLTTANGSASKIESMRIAGNNVGIGTITPVTRLDVSGAIRISMDSATCAASYAGAIRYNAGAVEFCNGTAWGSFAGSVTSSTIISALGYTPANSATVNSLSSSLTTITNSQGTSITSLNSSVLNLSTSYSALAASITALSASGTQWSSSGTNIYYMAGNVGIGTSAPDRRLTIVGDGTAYGDDVMIEATNNDTTGTYSQINLAKSRGTPASRTTVLAGDTLGALSYRGWASSSFGYAANIISKAETDFGTAVNGDLRFQTTSSGSLADRMIINSAGYVGVGTSAPRQILDVAPATGNSIIRATSTNSTAALQLYRNTAGAYTGPVLWSNGTSLNFGFDSSENSGATLMTLREYGALGIGTTNPTTILSAYQNNGADAAIALTNASVGQGAYVTSVAQSNFSGFTATGVGASWFSGQYGSTNYVVGDLQNSKIPFTLSANAPTNSFYMTASGSVGIGGVAATAKLHLAAGAATAGTAPLKLTSGTLTTAAEPGAIEYDGFNLYVTNGAGTRSALGSGSSVTSSSVISALGYAPVSSSAVSQWTTSGSTINYTSGNIGIGTSNPTKLVTLSGSNIGMNFYDTTYANTLINLYNSGGNGNIDLYAGATNVVRFSAQNNVDSYMNSGANFGVGTTTPGARLGVKGAGSTSATLALNVTDSSNVPLLSVRNDGVVSIGASTRASSLGINVTNPVYALEVSGTNVARFTNVDTGGARLVMTNGSTGGRSWTLASTGSGSTGGAGLFHIADYGLGNIFSFKNDGSFGVNVAIPLAPLHVASTTAYMLFEETDTTQKFYQGVDTSRYFVRQGAATNPDLMTITNSGNVGIGNSSPSFPLDIWTTASFNARYVHTSNNANDDAAFILARQRGTVASPLAVQSGDAIGGFYFRPYDGSSMNNTTAYIEVGAAQNHTTSLRGNYMTFATTVSGTNSNQEIMRIHSNGFVGIGNSNPNNLLQVGPSGGQSTNYGIYVASYNSSAGQAQYTGNWANTDWWGIGPATNSSSDNTLRIGNISDRTGTWSGTQNLKLAASNLLVGALTSGDDNGDYVIKSNGQLHIQSNQSGTSNTSYVHLVLEAGTATSSNSAVIMQTLGSERMRVDYNGNVGIGTAAPSAKLDVNGYSTTAGVGTVYLRNSYNSGGSKYWQIGPDGNGSGNFVVYNDGLAGAYIVYGQTTWSSSSDRRLKKEIEPIGDGLNKLLQLNGVTYHYNRDSASDPRKAGVIAQDVEKVLPEAITKDDNGFLSVKYTEIIPLVIEGVKELYQNMQAEFSSQKRQMASIEEENSRLKEENTLIKNYLCAKDPSAPFCKDK